MKMQMHSNEEKEMSYSYRRERYTSGKSAAKESYIRIIIVFTVLLACFCIIALQWYQGRMQKSELNSQLAQAERYEQELSILRTLNPYRIGSNEVLAKAVENVDLYPGWIARVYPIPKKASDASLLKDLGSFVLNETRFSLSSHKRYGIPQLNKSMYRLNGLYPNHSDGRLQVAIELDISSENKAASDMANQIHSCYVRIDINEKRVIDKKIHLMAKYQGDQMISGDVDLAKGLYPISAMMYCEENSEVEGENIQVAISFRNSAQYNLTSSRHSVFHIYKPENVIARL